MNIKKFWYKVKKDSFIGIIYEKYIGIRKINYIEKKNKEKLHKEGTNYIKIVEKALEKSGGLYYVYAGTLLGLIRDKKFIEWDLDIDYAIVISKDFSWNKLEKVMNNAGLKKSREFIFEGSIKEQSYMIKGFNIDFFGQFYEEDHMLQYSFEFKKDYKYNNENERNVYLVTLPKVIKTKKIFLNNTLVSIPENSEEILKAIYNDNWHIPNPNWKSNSGKNTILLKDKIAKCILY